MSLSIYRREWFGTIVPDTLSGIIVAFALIPEAIGFSIIAGVDPKIGLFSSCIIPVVAAFLGGRPAMISAATGAMALLMTDLVRDHGLTYLFAASIMAGIWQVVFGQLRLARYLKFIPRGVMTGFVNALAILIFCAQLPQIIGASLSTYIFLAIGLAVIYLFPRITKAVPSPLVAIIVVTLLAIVTHADVRRVGDIGALPSVLPNFAIPHIPLTADSLRVLLPISLTLAMVGLIETLLTARLVDEQTETKSNKNQECRSQGIANIITGFLGGMAGCAMIGQTMINVSSGGRGRLSTFIAGALLLVLILLLQHVLFIVPMAALVAVMIVVSISTFDWSSFSTLKRFPKSDTIVMLTTVAATLVTRDLSIGVIFGVILSALGFARNVAKQIIVTSELSAEGGHRTYSVRGQLFFVSTEAFTNAFATDETLASITIDLSHAHLWDSSAIGAIDNVCAAFERRNIQVNLLGLNEASATLLERVGNESKMISTT